MRYEAPQVLQTVNASRHIMGTKSDGTLMDSVIPTELNRTPAAYEADE
jgi:hypothetical protein